MENDIAQKITAFATIIALPFALGAFILTWATGRKAGKRRAQAKLKMDYLDSPKLV